MHPALAHLHRELIPFLSLHNPLQTLPPRRPHRDQTSTRFSKAHNRTVLHSHTHTLAHLYPSLPCLPPPFPTIELPSKKKHPSTHSKNQTQTKQTTPANCPASAYPAHPRSAAAPQTVASTPRKGTRGSFGPIGLAMLRAGGPLSSLSTWWRGKVG